MRLSSSAARPVARAGCYTSNFVSADLKMMEGPGGTHVAHDEDIYLGGGDVGVMVTWEVGLGRHR